MLKKLKEQVFQANLLLLPNTDLSPSLGAMSLALTERRDWSSSNLLALLMRR